MSGYQILKTITVDVADGDAVTPTDRNASVDVLIIDSVLAPRDKFAFRTARSSWCFCDGHRFAGRYTPSHKPKSQY